MSVQTLSKMAFRSLSESVRAWLAASSPEACARATESEQTDPFASRQIVTNRDCCRNLPGLWVIRNPLTNRLAYQNALCVKSVASATLPLACWKGTAEGSRRTCRAGTGKMNRHVYTDRRNRRGGSKPAAAQDLCGAGRPRARGRRRTH